MPVSLSRIDLIAIISEKKKYKKYEERKDSESIAKQILARENVNIVLSFLFIYLSFLFLYLSYRIILNLASKNPFLINIRTA